MYTLRPSTTDHTCCACICPHRMNVLRLKVALTMCRMCANSCCFFVSNIFCSHALAHAQMNIETRHMAFFPWKFIDSHLHVLFTKSIIITLNAISSLFSCVCVRACVGAYLHLTQTSTHARTPVCKHTCMAAYAYLRTHISTQSSSSHGFPL